MVSKRGRALSQSCRLTTTHLPISLSIAPEFSGSGLAVGQLFAPFQRLHDRSHPAIGGVGLGLALVHTVIHRHGGTLEVDSDVGQGAEFRLVLPLRN